MTPTPTDYSDYTAINYIGDIQGCYDALMDYFAAFPIRDDELYVFVGDYLDRGVQNDEVLAWCLANYERSNLVFLEGNHDRHLRAWTRGESTENAQFEHGTRPQLDASGIDPSDAAKFTDELHLYHYAKHGDTIVIASHGGLDDIPEHKSIIEPREFIRGTGDYRNSDEIDAQFAAAAPAGTYQIHGHRNFNRQPIRVNHSCFNLEGRVEFSGELRSVRLASNEFEIRSIASHHDASDSLIVPNHGANGARPTDTPNTPTASTHN